MPWRGTRNCLKVPNNYLSVLQIEQSIIPENNRHVISDHRWADVTVQFDYPVSHAPIKGVSLCDSSERQKIS